MNAFIPPDKKNKNESAFNVHKKCIKSPLIPFLGLHMQVCPPSEAEKAISLCSCEQLFPLENIFH